MRLTSPLTMRLTTPLTMPMLRKPDKNWYNRYFKYLWRVGSVQPAPPTTIPECLRSQGVEITDTADQNFLAPPRGTFTWPEPRMNKLRGADEHPHFHRAPIFIWGNATWLRGGLTQVQSLTRTLVREGLPARVQASVGEVGVSHGHESVQRGLCYAHLWDATMARLPMTLDHVRRHYRPKRAFGVPYRRLALNVVEQLRGVCEKASVSYPGLLDHISLYHRPAIFTFSRAGEQVQIRGGKQQYLELRRSPLPPYGDAEEVEASRAEPLPNIFPLRATAGLPESKLYEEGQVSCGYDATVATALYPDTLFLIAPLQWWGREERVGRALTMSFSQCMALAHTHHSHHGQPLSPPITVKCVITNGREVDFVCYQLNTTTGYGGDGDGVDTVKNLAWVDAGHEMFESVDRERQQLVGYNPGVIDKLLALFVDGTEPRPP